jgi:hypothetical protein
MRNLFVETDIAKVAGLPGKDAVNYIYDSVTKKVVPADSVAGKRALLYRLTSIMRAGPLHSHARPGGCLGIVGFLQVHGTCWFNAICHALIMSDLGSKLMRALYADWAGGIRAGNDAKRSRILRTFRLMVDLSAAHPRLLLVNPIKPINIIRSLSRYSPEDFANVGRYHGYWPQLYVRKLLAFLGVPRERVLQLRAGVYRGVPGGDTATLDDRLRAALSKTKAAPLVVIADVPEHTSTTSDGDNTSWSPNRATYIDRAGVEHTYLLDAAVMVSLNRRRGNEAHAIAGVTCNGKRILIDSNPAHGGLNSDTVYSPSEHARGRVVEYDWRSSRKEIETLTLPEELYFVGARSYKTAFYYNKALLDQVYAASKDVAQSALEAYTETNKELHEGNKNLYRKQLRQSFKM